MPWSRFDRDHAAPGGERDLSYCAALREAIDQAMGLDPRVFAIGLDADDKFGVFGSMLEPLGLKLDYGRIKTARPKIAEMLR